jgi:hypothetical protein
MMTSMTTHEGRPVFTVDQIQFDWYDAYIESVRNAVAQKMHGKKWGSLDKTQKEAVSAEIGAMRQRGETLPGVKDEAKIAELRSRLEKAENDSTAIVDNAVGDIIDQVGFHRQSEFTKTRDHIENWLRVSGRGPEAEILHDAEANIKLLRAEIATAEAAIPPPHPLAATLDQPLNTTLRRAIRQAAEAGADYIAIPSGDTVLSYNPGDEGGMRGFYGSATSEGIVPKNLRKLLAQIDKDAARPLKIDTLDSPSGKTGLGKGFTLFPLTDAVKRSVLEEGQPLFSAVPRRNEKRQKDIDGLRQYISDLRNGKTVNVPAKTRRAVHEALKPDMHMVPDGVPVRTVRKIVPGSVLSDGDMEITLHMETADGTVSTIPFTLTGLEGIRAFRLGSSINFLTLATGEGFARTARGELWHELIHQIRSSGLLSGTTWNRLLRHAKSLRVMDTEIATHLRSVGVPTWESAGEGTIREAYQRLYAGRSNYTEIMNQEAVAHFIDLYATDNLLPMEVDPVRDILDDMAAGRLSGKGRAISATNSTPLFALGGGLGRSEASVDADVGQSMRRDLDALGYYSKALEAAKGLKQAKGTPEQMLAQLKKAGVKDAEIDATGLRAALDGKKSITRDDIVSHLEGNRVGLKEVTYAGKSNEGMGGGLVDDDAMAGIFGDVEQGDVPSGTYGPTKWSSRSLDPSNPTYRETVLHLPEVSDATARKTEFRTRMEAKYGEDYLRQLTPDEEAEMVAVNRAKYRDNFTSGHFPEPNIVGHMMTSMVKLPLTKEEIEAGLRASRDFSSDEFKSFKDDGHDVFLIDQIQSDWGQKLRDGGVRDEAKIAELKRRLDEQVAKADAYIMGEPAAFAQDAWRGSMPKLTVPNVTQYLSYLQSGERPNTPKLSPDKMAMLGVYRAKIDDLVAPMQMMEAELRTAEASTPGNPLVNTTDQWVNITLRRAIRQASEAGADYIAIPSGKTVESYNTQGDSEGNAVFYEKIVPKNLRNLLGKIDKASATPVRVETLDSPSGKTGLGQGFTLLPLTDAVKRSVLEEGQPLFSAVPRMADVSEPFQLERRPMSAVDLHAIADANFDMPYVVETGVSSVPIADLQGNAFYSEKVGPLAEAIRTDRWIEPLVIDGMNNVIEGQHRLRALAQLGFTHVPVHRIREILPYNVALAIRDAALSAGIHSQQARQIVINIAEIVDQEGIGEIDSYAAPRGFERAWTAAVEVAKGMIEPTVFSAVPRRNEKRQKDIDGLRQYWRLYVWPDESTARAHLRRRIEQSNAQYGTLFGMTDVSIVDELRFVKRGKGVGLSQVGMRVDRAPIEITDEPVGSAPDVDFSQHDLVNEGSAESALASYGRDRGRALQGYIAAEHLPKPRGTGIKNGRPSNNGYFWDELAHRGRASFPPATIRINRNGSVSILDGNHRIAYWVDQGHDSIPVFVIDERLDSMASAVPRLTPPALPGATTAVSIEDKIANMEAINDHIGSLTETRRPITPKLDVVTQPDINGRVVYYVLAKGKPVWNSNGSPSSSIVGRFDVKPSQRMDVTGVEVTNALAIKTHQRQGIGTAVYDMVSADFEAFGGVSPSPDEQLSPDAQSFWKKRLTPAASAKQNAIEKAAQKAVNIVNRIAGVGAVDVRFPQVINITGVPEDTKAAAKSAGRDLVAAGLYRPPVNGRAVIELALGVPGNDFETVAGHEAYHHVEKVLATPAEMKLLRAPSEMARATRLAAAEIGVSMDVAKGFPDYEIRAMAFQRYRRLREEGASTSGIHIGVRRFWDRLIRIFQNVRNALRGQGFDSMESIFELARTGEMAKRGSESTSSTSEGTSAEKMASLGGQSPSLDMSPEARKAKAGAMGFDTGRGWYHGASDSFDSFDLTRSGSSAERGVWLTNSADDASEFAGMSGGENSNVGQYYIRGNIKRVRWPDAEDPLYMPDTMAELIRVAKDEGYDGLRVAGVQNFEGSRPSTSVVVFDPRNIRSVNAAFDPAKSDSPQLMASFFPTATSSGTQAGRAVSSRMARMGAYLAPTVDQVRIRVQDYFLKMKRQEQAIERQTGAPLPEQLRVYDAEGRMTKKAAARMANLDRDHLDPIYEMILSNDLVYKDLSDYLIAMHAKERNDYIRSIDPTNDMGSGITDQEAIAILQRIAASGKQAAYDAAADRVRAITRLSLDSQLSSGLISQERYDALANGWQYYVPLRGFEVQYEDDPEFARSGRGLDVRGPESFKAMGRRTKSDDPLEYVLMQAYETIIRSEKNTVKKTLLRLVTQHPDPAVWNIYRGEYRRRVVDDPSMPSGKRVETYWVNAPFSEKDNDITGVKVGGKQVYIQLKDRQLARAFKGVAKSDFDNALVRAMSVLSRNYARLLTSLNPEFVVGNFFRDAGTAYFNSKSVQGLDAAARRKIMADAFSLKAIRGISQSTSVLQFQKFTDKAKAKRAAIDADYARLKASGFGTHVAILTELEKTHGYAAWYEDFRKAGGQTGYLDAIDVDRIKRRIETSLTQGKTGRAFRSLGQFVENANGAVENGIRLSTYVALRKSGVSEATAATEAGELTTNFNRKGEWGTIINSLYIFFNASTQGSVRILQAMKNPAVVRAVVGIVGFGIFLDVLNYMTSGDDDDGENAYEKIESWIKDRNLIFMLPGRTDYIPIPLPYGYNVPFILGMKSGELFRTKATQLGLGNWGGKTTVAKATVDVAKSIIDAFNPIAGSETTPLQALTPTMLDPIAQIAENKNWNGRPIYPTKYDRNQPDSENYFRSVDPAFKSLARLLNSATGGNDARSGTVDVSPDGLQHYAQFLGGGVTRFILNGIGTAQRAFNGEEWVPHKTPFIRRLYGRTDGSDLKRVEYNKAKNIVTAAMYEYRKLAERGNRDGAIAVRKEWEPELEASGVFKATAKALSALGKEEDRVKLNASLTAETRKARIDELKAREKRLITRAMKVYVHAKKKYGVNR